MYTTTPLGLCVKTTLAKHCSQSYRRYTLRDGKGTLGATARMSQEAADNANNALFEGGSDYRWVLVEGGE